MLSARYALGFERVCPPVNANMYYLLSLFLLALSPFLELPLIPVVEPDFILLDFILPDFILVSVAPGPTLPSLDAPGAGCVCADAIAVVPNSEATTRAEIASLDRMRCLLHWISDARVKTCDAGLGSAAGAYFRVRPAPSRTAMEPPDQLGQEQPRDKARARQVSRKDRGGDPPGEKT
jgi:hypothetical protein